MSSAPLPRASLHTALHEQFRDDAMFLDDHAARPLLTDWRKRYHGKALAVAAPRDTAAVARLMAWCHQHAIPVVPQGGNTGLVGGATPSPDGTAVLISTRHLNRIRHVDPLDQTMTLEAGCTLAQAQQAAADHQRLFPLSLASEGSCTVGGNLATNAGGTQVLRYGNMRDLTLGLEVVLPDGRLWNGLSSLRKNNTGLDLKHLFIGTEGTLGLITAATVKLFPQPGFRQVAWIAMTEPDQAQRFLEMALNNGGPAITAFELVSKECMQLLARTTPGLRLPHFADTAAWQALVEWSGFADPGQGLELLCAQASESGFIHDAVVACSEADIHALWRLRESIPEAQNRAGGNVKHDISLPLSAIVPFVRTVPAALQALSPQLQAYVFGHLGDGNLHFNIGVAAGADPRLSFSLEADINAIVYGHVRAMGGSISAEHGLGQLRRHLAADTKETTELDLLQTIKTAVDPRGLMNPGKSLPLSPL